MKPYRKHIQMIFQDPYSSLNPRMLVRDIIKESLDINSTLNENQKLKKDNKSIFAQNIKLDNTVTELKKKINAQQEKINAQQIEIETYLEKIKKLKDKSHHGG